MKNNQNLFFSPEEKGRAFSDVLKEVQEYISSKYSTLMVEGGSEEVKQQVKRYITKYICDYRITVKGKTQEQLIDDLYTEMAEFSFLTKYIFGTGIEEIDINSWRDIEIQYNDGRCEKLEEHFESPEHAVNVIRRMLHVSGMVLDNASPAVLGHLSKNIRIAVLKTPLVDEDVGIAASIRIVNPQSLKKENFVDGGTATGEMLDFLAECLRYGISICVAGATSSGKTTLAGWLLTTIPDGKRIFTIENGSRELALVREKDGKVTNSVIHTLTRYSENEKQNIDQDMLFNVLSYMSNELLTNGHTAACIDEFYLFLTNLTAVEYIRNFMKRVRKKDSAVILASQNLEDFNIDGIREYTKPLFSIPTHVFLFNAGNIDSRFYIDTLQLEQSEYNLIRYPQRGVCLYKCGNERYNLMVHAPEYKEKLFGSAGGR